MKVSSLGESGIDSTSLQVLGEEVNKHVPSLNISRTGSSKHLPIALRNDERSATTFGEARPPQTRLGPQVSSVERNAVFLCTCGVPRRLPIVQLAIEEAEIEDSVAKKVIYE